MLKCELNIYTMFLLYMLRNDLNIHINLYANFVD